MKTQPNGESLLHSLTQPSAPGSRRSFFSKTLTGGAAALALASIPFSTSRVMAGVTGPDPTAGDIAILKFLAAAELLECDLWGQYCELATGNRPFIAALRRIDAGLPEYVCQDFADECSHAALINAYLVSIGQEAVNLDPFRTLPSSMARGAESKGRLTSLTNLTVDTSYYNRYRGAGNPDFGDTFPQIVDIVHRPAIPTGNRNSPIAMATFAQVAAFHFGMIEQGGSSLYTNLLGKVSSPDVVAILSSIGPTEFYHFAVFQTSLEGIRHLGRSSGVNFPALNRNPARFQVMPKPCKFLSAGLPVSSVLRPIKTENAGAVATVTALANSGLFTGQTAEFVAAATALATAADAATRTCM